VRSTLFSHIAIRRYESVKVVIVVNKYPIQVYKGARSRTVNLLGERHYDSWWVWFRGGDVRGLETQSAGEDRRGDRCPWCVTLKGRQCGSYLHPYPQGRLPDSISILLSCRSSLKSANTTSPTSNPQATTLCLARRLLVVIYMGKTQGRNLVRCTRHKSEPHHQKGMSNNRLFSCRSISKKNEFLTSLMTTLVTGQTSFTVDMESCQVTLM
jgi:hypothetical protein